MELSFLQHLLFKPFDLFSSRWLMYDRGPVLHEGRKISGPRSRSDLSPLRKTSADNLVPPICYGGKARGSWWPYGLIWPVGFTMTDT